MNPKIKLIRSGWWEGYGYRLDCQPYVTGSLDTKILLENLSYRKESLSSLTKGYDGGIFTGPHFARHYVESLDFGVPFLSSSKFSRVDLTDIMLLSKRDAFSPKLRHLELKQGIILISCSGTIGNMGYVRKELEGMWSSQDILKVVPDPNKISPGYLYSFLCSKFGIPLLTSGTYGSIIQHLEPGHISGIPIPRIDDAMERTIHALVEEAGKLRTDASEVLQNNSKQLLCFLEFQPLKNKTVWGKGWSYVQNSNLNLRFDAHYHSASAHEVENQVRKCHTGFKKLSIVTNRLFKPPMFKRLWVDDEKYGAQFISGIDAYCYRSNNPRYVSKAIPKFEEFILKRGWLIFQAAGSIDGLFGRPLYVNGWLENRFGADDLYRVVPNNEEDGAYLYAYFRTPYGRISIQRESAGHAIPRVWDPQMKQVLVPWPKENVRKEFAMPVIEAHERIEKARQLEDKAVALLENIIENN